MAASDLRRRSSRLGQMAAALAENMFSLTLSAELFERSMASSAGPVRMLDSSCRFLLSTHKKSRRRTLVGWLVPG